MTNFFSKERDVAQAVSICRALAKMAPNKYGHAPDTDEVLGQFPEYHAVAFKVAYDARVEALKRIYPGRPVSIYERSQASDDLAARLLRGGWLPRWYLERDLDGMLRDELE